MEYPVEASDASRRTREEGRRHAVVTIRLASLIVARACGDMSAVAAGCKSARVC